jgi:hypothetical protein
LKQWQEENNEIKETSSQTHHAMLETPAMQVF